MTGMRSSNACRRQFKRLDILPILCQYIFSLMVSVLDITWKYFRLTQ